MPNTFTDSGEVNLKLPEIADESTVKRTINQKPDEIGEINKLVLSHVAL